MNTDKNEVRREPEITRPIKDLLQRNPYYNDATSRTDGKELGTRFFFLSPRGTSGERTEERGGSSDSCEWLLLSPTLSSIRWRRGSGCGFAAVGPSVSICGFHFSLQIRPRSSE